MGGLTTSFTKALKTKKCSHLKNAYDSSSTAENYTHKAIDALNASFPLSDSAEALVMSAYSDTQAMLDRSTKSALLPVAQTLVKLVGAIVRWKSPTVEENVKNYGTIKHRSAVYEEVASDLQTGREAMRLQLRRLVRFGADMKLIKESVLVSLTDQNSSDSRCSAFDFETLKRLLLDAISRLVGDDAEAEVFSQHFRSSL